MTTSGGQGGLPLVAPLPPLLLPPDPPSSMLRRPGPFTAERPRASWGLRVLAVLLDSAIVATVVWFFASGSPALAVLPLFGGGDESLSGAAMWWTWGSVLALGVLQAYTGMTPGKRVAGIAVVDAGTHRPIGILGTVLRWLAHFLDAILMIGYLRAAWHPEGRTFADSLLGTVVVRSTRPEPHPWVAATGRARDRRAPWLRWPRHLTGAVALVLCAVGAAAWLVQGSGGSTGSTASTSCRSTGPLDATANFESDASIRSESHLGVERVTSRTWSVVVGWTSGDGVPDDGVLDDATPSLSVRSPDGQTYSSSDDLVADGGDYWLSSSLSEEVSPVTGMDVPQDVSGWTAHAVLTGDDGTVLAECSAPLPQVSAVDPQW